MSPAFPGHSTARSRALPFGGAHAGRAAARRPTLLACAMAVAASACGEPDVVEVPLRIGGLASCPIGDRGGAHLTAYGDFARPVVWSWDRGDGASPLPLPQTTRAVRAFLSGLAPFVASAERPDVLPGSFDLVLLPESSSACALSFDGLLAPAGAPMVAARNDGSFVVAGGEAEGLGDARVFLWSPATRRFSALDGLASRRLLATAVTTPDGTVVIAGGAAGRDSGANATAELMLPGAAAIERAPISLGEPRCDHAAAALADGTVLLLGGRSSPDGAPVRTAEIIDVALRRTRADFAPMIVARAGHDAAVLDDGSVVIAGGVDADRRPVMLVERFDPTLRTFIAEESFAPEHACDAGWTIVPLIGARALFIARCPNTPRYVLLRVGGLTRFDRDSAQFVGVVAAAAARTDGRVLQVGRDGDDAPWAELLDGARWDVPDVLAIDESGRTDAYERMRLVPLASGDLVEVAWRNDPPVQSHLRLRSGAGRSIFATPAGSYLTGNADSFALDAAFVVGEDGDTLLRWDYLSGIRPFVRGAEAWLERARFARFTLQVSHAVDDGDPTETSAVLVSRLPAPLSRTGAPLRIEWNAARVSIRAEPECATDAPIAAGTDQRVIVVERLAADRIRATITDTAADGATLATWSVRPCVVRDLPERVAVGLAPARGHRLSSFTITR